jgi:uncharacterized membrane protein (DUF485 family)
MVGQGAHANLALAQGSRRRRAFQSAQAHHHPRKETAMDEDLARRIAGQSHYQMLKDRRSRLGWVLTALMMLVYYGFILLVAFNKPFLATPIGGGVTTLGIPIGFGVIVFTIAITAYYVRRANAEFDTLSDSVVKGASR